MLVLYPRPSSSTSKVLTVPSGVTASTLTRISFISPPYAPAFIKHAPPRVPGIPHANSNPASPAFSALLPIAERRAPAPALIVSPSTDISDILRPIMIIRPSYPLSDIRTLLPLPMM